MPPTATRVGSNVCSVYWSRAPPATPPPGHRRSRQSLTKPHRFPVRGLTARPAVESVPSGESRKLGMFRHSGGQRCRGISRTISPMGRWRRRRGRGGTRDPRCGMPSPPIAVAWESVTSMSAMWPGVEASALPSPRRIGHTAADTWMRRFVGPAPRPGIAREGYGRADHLPSPVRSRSLSASAESSAWWPAMCLPGHHADLCPCGTGKPVPAEFGLFWGVCPGHGWRGGSARTRV